MDILDNDICGKNVWLTTIWDVNPVKQKGANYGRMFALGEYLSKRGCNVTIWFSTFDHPTKTHLYNEDTVVDIGENEKIVLMHSPIGYKRNMSPIRVIYDVLMADKMKKMFRDKDRFGSPDLILCSYPTEQYCRVALKYGKKHNIPVVLDARDMWPDIFERAFPRQIRFAANLALLPLKMRAKAAFKNASAICGVSDVIISWALKYASREQCGLDRPIFIGSKKRNLPSNVLEEGLEEWRRLGISKDTWNICLFSSLSSATQDLDTVVSAVKSVHETHPNIRFIVGGRGDAEEHLRELAKELPFIHIMGWMSANQMDSLMSISKVGLLCYKNTPDYKDAWGNKVGQYLSYGLPVLTSTEGIAKRYFNIWNCGAAYKEGDSKELSDLICSLMEDEDRHKMMSSNAYERFLSDFEADVVAGKFEKLILDVIYEKKE